jgi:hypothetical protein
MRTPEEIAERLQKEGLLLFADTAPVSRILADEFMDILTTVQELQAESRELRKAVTDTCAKLLVNLPKLK